MTSCASFGVIEGTLRGTLIPWTDGDTATLSTGPCEYNSSPFGSVAVLECSADEPLGYITIKGMTYPDWDWLPLSLSSKKASCACTDETNGSHLKVLGVMKVPHDNGWSKHIGWEKDGATSGWR